MATNGENAYELHRAALGQSEGSGAWLEVDQARIDAFAEVTEDRQFIHVDPELCATLSPWGVPIAHFPHAVPADQAGRVRAHAPAAAAGRRDGRELRL